MVVLENHNSSERPEEHTEEATRKYRKYRISSYGEHAILFTSKNTPQRQIRNFFCKKYVLQRNDRGEFNGGASSASHSVKQTADAEAGKTDEVERDIHSHEKNRSRG